MNGGSFLVSLREVLNSERILRCRSLTKENINFWEEDLASENQECVTVIEDMFDTGTQEIVESILDENSPKVATTIAGYVAKNLIKRSKYESCKILLKAGDIDIANDVYLNVLSRGGSFVLTKLLADFVRSNFAILDFIETDIVPLSLPAKKSATYVLRHY